VHAWARQRAARVRKRTGAAGGCHLWWAGLAVQRRARPCTHCPCCTPGARAVWGWAGLVTGLGLSHCARHHCLESPSSLPPHSALLAAAAQCVHRPLAPPPSEPRGLSPPPPVRRSAYPRQHRYIITCEQQHLASPARGSPAQQREASLGTLAPRPPLRSPSPPRQRLHAWRRPRSAATTVAVLAGRQGRPRRERAHVAPPLTAPAASRAARTPWTLGTARWVRVDRGSGGSSGRKAAVRTRRVRQPWHPRRVRTAAGPRAARHRLYNQPVACPSGPALQLWAVCGLACRLGGVLSPPHAPVRLP
jgi:hypothetical protein